MTSVHSLSSRSGSHTEGVSAFGTDGTFRVVVAGEVSSGKSAMINAIARSNIIPRLVGLSYRPAMLVQYSEVPFAAIQKRDGTVEHVDGLQNLSEDDDVSICIVGTSQPHLKGLELIELPFYHEGEIGTEARELLEVADATIWMTIASQAWRLSEKAILDRLRPFDPSRVLLGVSRADKIRNTHDLDRIRERLAHETEGYFKDIFCLHAPNRLISDSFDDERIWAETAGRSVYRALKMIEPLPRQHAHEADVIDIKTKKQIRKADLKPVAITEAFSHLPPIVDTLVGVIAAGIVDTHDDTVMALAGDDKTVVQVANTCTNWIGYEEALATAQGQSAEDLENENGHGLVSEIKMSNHFIIYCKSRRAGKLMFMMCKSARINPAIANTAFRRLWAEL